MLWLPLTVLAAVANLVSADVEFVSPKGGSTLSSSSLIAEWKDSGETPALSDLVAYELFLMAGGNDAATMFTVGQITTAGGSQFSITGNKATGTIDFTKGAAEPKNAYFLKIVSSAKTGVVTNYSKRFSISGMTGTFPQNVLDGMETVTGQDGPPRDDQTGGNAPANPADGDFGIAYTMQTGTMRFAPMQPVPKTKITKKQHTPMFPTSSVSVATTFLPIPKQKTTMTKSQTFSVSSRENPASPAPMPNDDMAKYLARWKD